VRWILGSSRKEFLRNPKKTDRQSIPVTDNDVLWYDRYELVLSGLLGGIFGFVGTFFIWVAVALVYPIFADPPPITLILLEIIGTLVFTLLGVLSNRIVARIAIRGMISTTSVQLFLSAVYGGAVVLALNAIFSVEGIIPGRSLPIALTYSGVYFYLLAPR
jgi:hypothetical protein